MPSNAFHLQLEVLLVDAYHLVVAIRQLPTGLPGRLDRQAAMCRTVVVTCLSAWEAYIEELVRECLVLLRPAAPPLGLWPALNAAIRGQLSRFNTPSTDNVRLVISDALGLQNIQHSWTWQNCSSDQAVQRLATALDQRHQIAHGVNPRPTIAHAYSSQLPEFFRRLARCTDRAVRQHLVAVLGIANPWPL